MALYEILLHGRGLKLLEDDGTTREGGVYAWRAVRAADEDSAVALARDALLNDPLFATELSNESLDELDFTAEEIRRKPFGESAKQTNPVFYIEEDE